MDKKSQSRRAIELGIDDLMFADLCKLTKAFVFANFDDIRHEIRVDDVSVKTGTVLTAQPALHQ